MLQDSSSNMMVRYYNGQSYNDLHQAACKGHVREVEQLLKENSFDLDEQEPKRDTALFFAACNGHQSSAAS